WLEVAENRRRLKRSLQVAPTIRGVGSTTTSAPRKIAKSDLVEEPVEQLFQKVLLQIGRGNLRRNDERVGPHLSQHTRRDHLLGDQQCGDVRSDNAPLPGCGMIAAGVEVPPHWTAAAAKAPMARRRRTEYAGLATNGMSARVAPGYSSSSSS